MTLRVTTVFGQDPAFADPHQGIIVNVLIRITPNTEASKQPVNIVWVQDRSSSMTGEKLEQSKRVLDRLISQFTEDDSGGIIAFDDEMDVVLEHKQMRPWHRRVARKRVKNIVPGKCTTLAPPLLSATDMGNTSSVPRTVVMLTDGVSYGNDIQGDRKRFLENAKHLADKSGRLILVGMGTDYDADLLEQACAFDPSFELFHISTTDPEQFRCVTEDVMAELRGSVMGKLKISGTAEKKVQIRRVTTFVPRQRDRAVEKGCAFSVESGSLSQHRGQHLLIEMMVKKPKRGNNPLVTMTIEGVIAQDDGSTKQFTDTHALAIRCTDNAVDGKKPVNQEVRDCIVRAQAHRLMEQHAYEAAAKMYDAIGDSYMAKQARWAHQESLVSEVLGKESHRATTTHSSRSVTTDWTSRKA